MNWRDRGRYRKCQACDTLVLPPRRKCNSCRKSVSYTTVELNASRKGMKKRGTTLSKPDKVRTKRAKRQHPEALGQVPHLRASNWRFN